MQIERATTADFINAVANDPSVRPHLLGEGRIDYSPVLLDPRNVVLTDAFGGAVFHCKLPGLYEIHTQILPDGRARSSQMIHEALLWMFTRTDAVEVVTRVPRGNDPARRLTIAAGGVLEQTVQGAFDGQEVIWGIYRLTIQDWLKSSPLLERIGQLFHEKLFEQYIRMGLTIHRHDDDPWQNVHAGAAQEMIMHGQVAKGIGFYNRFAAMAMAPMIGLVSLDPLVVDIRDAWLLVRGQDFEVMEKRG